MLSRCSTKERPENSTKTSESQCACLKLFSLTFPSFIFSFLPMVIFVLCSRNFAVNPCIMQHDVFISFMFYMYKAHVRSFKSLEFSPTTNPYFSLLLCFYYIPFRLFLLFVVVREQGPIPSTRCVTRSNCSTRSRRVIWMRNSECCALKTVHVYECNKLPYLFLLPHI